ncbi:MAG: hypothetical protein WCS92_00095 [Candidatus Babeliales bacterium]
MKIFFLGLVEMCRRFDLIGDLSLFGLLLVEKMIAAKTCGVRRSSKSVVGSQL